MTGSLQAMVLLLLMSAVEMNERFQYYQNYRLEKLCRPDGGKVRMKLEDSVASFQLNSSLIPGNIFNCHLELVLETSDSGFFVYFDSLLLSEETGGDCEEDYVQFGRDILFITSHRSSKFCGCIEGSLMVPPATRGNNTTTTNTNSAEPDLTAVNVTPLDKRIYSEHSDTEMDIWIKIMVPHQTGTRPKTLSLIVTPYRQKCSKQDRRYKRCGGSQHCIRSELFCDGNVNCAVGSQLPPDEAGCKVTTVPPVADNTIWEHPSLPHALGTFLTILFLSLLLFYIVKNCWHNTATALPKDRSSLGGGRRSLEQSDLIQMEGMIVPVSRPRVTRIPPPSYNDSIISQNQQREFQQSFTSTMGFTPQYSYANR